MYTAEETRKWQQLTGQWLKDLRQKKELSFNKTETRSLQEALRFHEYRYYILNDPLVSDGEYDQLYKSLEKTEAENPDRVTADSPTQRVAKGLTRDFPKVQHLVPMLSLDNSYDAADLVDWDRRARELGGVKEIEYCVEPKFDGASISLIYEDDLLQRGATRGDGVTGDEITTNIKRIRSVPLSAAFSKYNIQQIEIRGEVMMNKTNFAKYNEQMMEEGLPPLANPRNAAAGSLRIKDAAEVGRRNLEAFLYHISYITLKPGKAMPKGLLTHSGSLQLLWDLGFRSPAREKKLFKGIKAVVDYVEQFEKERDGLPYEIDGMVIKVDDLALQDKLGMTTHHPRWAIAFKFKARQATSKLKGVEFQVGRTGAVTPVAKIDPVPVGGVTVTSISVHNEEYIKEKDLRLGDTVLIERSGDVIPQVVKSFPELRTGKEKKIVFPTHCPVCGDPLFKPEGEAVWRCINVNCKAQVVERIIHFVSKDAMDIRSMGEANVRKFYELGFLSTVPSVYTLPFDAIRKLEGYGEKSITNLQKAIEDSKSQPMHRLIYALGIRYVGETTAKTLAHAVEYLPEFANLSIDQLLDLEDVGTKVADSIHQFFHNKDNVKLLKELEKLGLNLRNDKRKNITDGNLNGQSFLFTGSLSKLKRSDAETMVEENGGKILGGVSTKLNYLVVGEDAGSKLEKARKIPAIKIISEDEFLKMVNR